MSVSIRISDNFYFEARSQAKAELRSIPSQVEYWARIGRTAMDNPEMSVEAIQALLVAKHQDAEPFEFRLSE